MHDGSHSKCRMGDEICTHSHARLPFKAIFLLVEVISVLWAPPEDKELKSAGYVSGVLFPLLPTQLHFKLSPACYFIGIQQQTYIDFDSEVCPPCTYSTFNWGLSLCFLCCVKPLTFLCWGRKRLTFVFTVYRTASSHSPQRLWLP